MNRQRLSVLVVAITTIALVVGLVDFLRYEQPPRKMTFEEQEAMGIGWFLGQCNVARGYGSVALSDGSGTVTWINQLPLFTTIKGYNAWRDGGWKDGCPSPIGQARQITAVQRVPTALDDPVSEVSR